METKICKNEHCGATTSPEWKKGWGLKSGGFAILCYNCGSAFENSSFCEKFHVEESGWRECKLCGKRIHCGCIASKHLLDYLDFGGIGCIRCTKRFESPSMVPLQIKNDVIPNGFGSFAKIADPLSFAVRNKKDENDTNKEKRVPLGKNIEPNEPLHFPSIQKHESNVSIGQLKQEENVSNLPQISVGSSSSTSSSIFWEQDKSRALLGLQDMYKSLTQTSLNFSLNSPNKFIPFPTRVVEGMENNKLPPSQQTQSPLHILPKPPKTGLSVGPEANKAMVNQNRIPRPPVEGRGRNQLLPRYWPRITDQELQQLSGDLNSTIVPLFEKVLSASDAGRIGRLVLPKACAEAYFPTINQSDGLPIKIQDIKGKEWTFQFRFWPNNNSRMYVLEGITPCIQNMQLQAGDTVTFSRIDPGGKLVMGFRKATNSVDAETSSLPIGGLSGETLISGVTQNLSKQGRTNEDSLERGLISEKKKTRNIGSKSKRLHMNCEDAVELRVTWDEAQELLRPSPSAKSTVVIVENHEIEEYDEPPVFGKRSLFTSRVFGEPEQWAQCDSCFKWRSLPIDVLLPPKWICSDNVWDTNRCSCSAPEDMTLKEVKSFMRAGMDFKKRRTIENRVANEDEPSGLDALATAAVMGENEEDPAEPSAGPTTKHPRHRPGCTCIVCIQPPSGKGKHKPACTCNVCLTVRRRFKTLMLRKKKAILPADGPTLPEMAVVGNGNFPAEVQEMAPMAVNRNFPTVTGVDEVAETSKGGRLDLNCRPIREEAGPGGDDVATVITFGSEQNGGSSLGFGVGDEGCSMEEEKKGDERTSN